MARLRAIVNRRSTLYDCVEFRYQEVNCVIVFDRLWETMKDRGISQYRLIQEYKVSNGQLDRLRKNGNVSTYTLNQLCKILHCRLDEIAEFIED